MGRGGLKARLITVPLAGSLLRLVGSLLRLAGPLLRLVGPLLVVFGVLPLLAGCGDARTAVPSLSRPAPPDRLHALRYPAAGVQFSAPVNWPTVNGHRALLAVLSSGPAVVAVWRYPRQRALPRDVPALKRARRALVARVRARDPTLRLIHSSILVLNGDPAVEVDALETIAGQLRRVRSTHVFAFGGEVVLDEYAPPGQFGAVDQAVFTPVKHSLQVAPVS